jgi:hypothetical protein
MFSPNKLVVCERCGFVAVLPETNGWEMHTTEKGLCPACVRDSEKVSDRKPAQRVKTAN